MGRSKLEARSTSSKDGGRRPSRFNRGRQAAFSLAAALFAAFGAAGSAGAYDALYACGDSLTDTWREPAEPNLHFDGRWSNGPLWVEYLSEKLGFAYNRTNNYAHSGAQTDDTWRQILRDFVPPAEPARSLYVVFAGGNDFIQTLDENGFDNSLWNAKVADSVNNLSNAVVALYDRGARDILVPNVVDVTKIPLLNKFFSLGLDYLRDKVKQLNAQLGPALDQVAAARPDLRLYRVDFYTQVRALLKNYRAYGFTNAGEDALADLTLDKSFDGPGRNYVFWDPIHPTTKAHAIVAEWFYETLIGPQPLLTSLATWPGKMTLTVSGAQIGKTYVVQRSVDFSTWTDVQSIFAATVPPPSLALTNDPPRGFFRLKIQP